MPLAFLELQRGWQLLPPTPQAELSASPWQQPTEFHRWLQGQLGRLGAAGIGEEIQRCGPSPAPEHQGAHPWRAIDRHRGQLEPAGLG